MDIMGHTGLWVPYRLILIETPWNNANIFFIILFSSSLSKYIIIHFAIIRRDFLDEIHQPSLKATVVSSIKREMSLEKGKSGTA